MCMCSWSKSIMMCSRVREARRQIQHVLLLMLVLERLVFGTSFESSPQSNKVNPHAVSCNRSENRIRTTRKMLVGDDRSFSFDIKIYNNNFQFTTSSFGFPSSLYTRQKYIHVNTAIMDVAASECTNVPHKLRSAYTRPTFQEHTGGVQNDVTSAAGQGSLASAQIQATMNTRTISKCEQSSRVDDSRSVSVISGRQEQIPNIGYTWTSS